MAIYHFSGTVISRSQGRSAVACAAYRSAERLVDERYEKVHDFTRKQDVISQEILLPKDAPEWMAEREKLWNAVEAHEKRKDAQLAREFNFALPKELTLEQNRDLARTFVQEQFVSQGMVADLCIHLDKNSEGENLPHAHVMLTLREVTEDGFGAKVRAWNDKALLVNWRENWAETANRYLALNGHDLQIDHRTLEAQGINLEPQHKIGPSVAKDRMARLEDHQRIAKENGERLFKDPGIALTALTRQQSTFTHQDIARFVHRHSVDAEQFEKIYERVKGDEALVFLGLDDKSRERFTTQEMIKLETDLLRRVQVLSQCEGHAVSGKHQKDALIQRSLSQEQQGAFWHLTEPQDVKCVVGYAGSGKSYLLGAAREAWEASGYRVQGVTLSGIAAETLEGSSGIESRTLASRLYYWEKGEQRLSEKDILVVDEAGMLGSRQMARIFQEADNGGAKVVLIGDPQQLQAIEAGAAFRSIAERVSTCELTEVRRQKEVWQREATKSFAKGHTSEALKAYDQHDHVHAFASQALAKEALVGLWNDTRIANPSQSQIMLAYTRVDVQELNIRARELRHAQGELGPDILLQTERGQKAFAVQDRLYFLKNDRALGVMNGTLGTLMSIEGQKLNIHLDNKENGSKEGNNKMVTLSLNTYNHLDHGYAATIHKSQGVTVDRSYILASRYLDLHSIYVGMSRQRESVDLFWSREEFLNQQQLTETLSRDRSKDFSVDYFKQHEFGVVRGIEGVNYPKTDELGLSGKTKEGLWQNTQDPMASFNKEAHRGLLEQKSKQRPKAQDEMREFKERYETTNPERAQELNETLIPAHEKAALVFVSEYTRLQELVSKGGRTQYLAEHSLKQLIEKASRQPELMDSLKKHHVVLAKEVETLHKSFTQQELGRGLGL